MIKNSHLRLTLVLSVGILMPTMAQALEYGEARHLLNRTGFGASDANIRALAPLSHKQAIQQLLKDSRTEAITPPPGWSNDPVRPRRRPRDMSDRERKQFQKQRRDQAIDLQAWWHREMVATPSQLTERMTLFWHNIFTTSMQKVKSPQLLFRQNALLRRHALGSFRKLLHEIARDPAMVLYLDNVTNRRGQPNENFAREVMELFTLGEGHYSEQDIKEAARAFTGWTVNRRDASFRIEPRWHDPGSKTFLGRTGNFNGDDILEIILQQDQVARHIADKLWQEFVSPTPDPDAVENIATAFRNSDYDIAVALQATLDTAEFWDPANRGTLIKSPVELIVGTFRRFEIEPPNYRMLTRVGHRLGQSVFIPPNVKGWPGGTAWITADSLLMRQQVLEAFTRGGNVKNDSKNANKDRKKKRMGQAMRSGLSQWVASLDGRMRQQEILTTLILPIPPVHPPAANEDPARFVRQLLLDPAYQLK